MFFYLLGFGLIGITGGSIAAILQSYFFAGNVVGGSWFAILQSIGMTWGIYIDIFLTLGLILLAAYWVYIA